jgi:hypothetical protein
LRKTRQLGQGIPIRATGRSAPGPFFLSFIERALDIAHVFDGFRGEKRPNFAAARFIKSALNSGRVYAARRINEMTRSGAPNSRRVNAAARQMDHAQPRAEHAPRRRGR